MADKQTKKTKNKKFIEGIGRRKTASARVRLYKGSGKIVVNDMPIDEYFPGETAGFHYNRPFELTDTAGDYDVSVVIHGSGKSSQLDAVVLGIARALVEEDGSRKSALKSKGLMTRDHRMVERKKPGRVKARKKRQSPKR